MDQQQHRTPTSVSCRQRHTPTPKMSERKKSLFGCGGGSSGGRRASTRNKNNLSGLPQTITERDDDDEDDDDDDLGPMSPLQFSSSPKSYDKYAAIEIVPCTPTKKHEIRTDFKNILKLSPLQNKQSRGQPQKSLSLTKIIKNKTFTSFDDDVDNKTTSPPPTVQSTLTFSSNKENYSSLIDTENALKTPNSCETSTTTTSTVIPRVSFRKSLIFDTGITPDSRHLSPTTKKFMQKQARLNNDSGSPTITVTTLATSSNDSNSKAKTSLSFSESIISPKAFYGSSLNQYDPFKNRRKSLPVPSKLKIEKKKITPTRLSKRHTIGGGGGGPVLGGFHGRGHKITKPKFVQLKTKSMGTTPLPSGQLKSMSKNQILQAAIEAIERKTKGQCTPSFKKLTDQQEQTNNLHDQSDDNAITREQIARLQNILKSHSFLEPIDKISRSINWSGIGTSTKISNQTNCSRYENKQSTSSIDISIDDSRGGVGGGFSSLDTSQNNKTVDDDDDDDDDENENDEQLSKRKFFKSRKSESSLKQYKIMKGVCATVKRGASIKLLSPKRKKQKKQDYDEYQSIQNEVNDIISMLNDPNNTTIQSNEQPQKMTSTPTTTIVSASNQINELDKYRQMLPYKTDDPEIYKRQLNLLDLLISNDICTEENFKIFIAEPNQHIEQANKILDALIVVDVLPYLDDIDDISYEEFSTTNTATGLIENIPTTSTNTNTTVENIIDDYPMSPESQILTMTSGLALESPPIHRNSTSKIQQNNRATTQLNNRASVSGFNKNDKPEKQQFFPIFIHKRRQTIDSSNFTTNKLIESNEETSKLKQWKSIGDKQLQLDAGQKKFGAHMCKECGMFYSQHEPEDELIHQKYHLSRSKLAFKGWQNERIVCHVPEWDLNGRILVITKTDTKKHQQYAEEVLAMVDEDLGFGSVNHGLKPGSMLYLAIAKQQVIGVCVAEIQKTSYPVVQNWGVLCMKTDQIIPVKCGISRIWVTPTYRRCGIARKLIDTVCNTFIFGYKLHKTDLAFSSPTNDGYELVKSILPSDQPVLVYDELD